MDVLKIGTRKSLLAMVQTEIVRDAIQKLYPQLSVELVPIMTGGDRQLDRSLASFGGKGVFTRELEEQLLDGRIDLAVHSAKDMPMELPDGLCIGAVIEREDPRDVVVTMDGRPLKSLPAGSVVGTSSLRRALQVRAVNPQVKIRDLRGNVQTRLKKLEEEPYDAIVLAAAGLVRLNLEGQGYHFEKMEPESFLPAAGQGILAVESRVPSDKEPFLAGLLQRLHSQSAGELLAAERAFLSELSCGCNAPAAAYCKREGGRLTMSVMYARDGKTMSHAALTREVSDLSEAKALGKAAARKVKAGKVYLIGAGPGDEGLFTLKGLECIKKADVIIYDNLIPESVINEARPDARLIYAGKRAADHHLKQSETNRLLAQEALDGNVVVRLKGGDPLIFGRGGEEAMVLREAGVEFEFVPGISSSYSVPAYAGIPVTHRSAASSFHVITGHEHNQKEKESLDYATLAREEGTLIFLMGLSNLPQIVERLIAHGKDPSTPAAVISEGTTSKQRMAVGTMADIAEQAARQGIRTPAVTVIGQTVSFHEALTWFGKRPLSGRRVLLTGTKAFVDKTSPVLRDAGAQTVSCSLIRTHFLDNEAVRQAAANLARYTWLVLTSVNGVEGFFKQLGEQRVDIRTLSSLKFAAIGAGTAKALEDRGIYCDCIPESFTSEGLAEALLPKLTGEDRVLLLRALQASPVLPERLKKQGIPFDNVALYETVTDDRRKEDLPRLLAASDYLVLASGSAVSALVSMAETIPEGLRVICIGPVTEKAAVKAGLRVHASAVEASAEGILNALLADKGETKETT